MSTATATQNQNGTKANDPWSVPVGGGNGGGDYVCCPPGNYPATIVGMYDVGYQVVPDFNNHGQTKDQRQLIVVVELGKKRPDGKPFVMASRYNFSMNDKATLYKVVTKVIGRKLSDGESFNPLSLLGVPVMVSVTNSGTPEKSYHNVNDISQFPEGFPVPVPTFPASSWTVMSGQPFPAGLDWLPLVYGETVKAMAEKAVDPNRAKSPPPATSNTAGGVGVSDDDIPF